MPAKSPDRRRLVSAVAHAKRYGDPELPRLRRELAVEGLAEHIREVVGAAPPLTAEHAAYLRGLLPAPAAE